MFKSKTTLEEFEKWLQNPEGLNLEYKTVKNSFSKDKDLPDYCAALANEGGGKLILGVNNNREVVGTNAFQGTHNKLSIELLNKIGIRVDVEELHHPEGRILIFHIPSRLHGQIVKSAGKYKYPMRVGESLVEMDTTKLKQILTETEIDFSQKIVPELSISDLDKVAIDNFKSLWVKKSK